MCTGLEIAALAAAVGGTAAGAAGQSANTRANARLQNQQTDLSRREFDSRNTLANEVFTQNTGTSREMYDQLNALDDEAFAARTGLSKQAFDQLNEIDRQQVIRDAAASGANVTAGRGIRATRDTEQDAARTWRDTEQDNARRDQYTEQDKARRTQYDEQDAARAQYGADLAAGNAAQDGYRGRADAEIASLLRAFDPAAVSAMRDTAAAGRNAAVSSAVTAGPSGPAGDVDPVLAKAFARYSAAGRDAATSRAAAQSRFESYGDAADAGGRNINRADTNVAMVADEAKRALVPLGAMLDASRLRYRGAGETGAARYTSAGDLGAARYGSAGDLGAARYTSAGDLARSRGAAADADLEAALGLSRTRAGGENRAVTSYTGAMDESLARSFAARGGNINDRGNTLINANEGKLAGTNAVSQNLESAMGGISQFRAANRGPSAWSTLGQFATAVTPTLFNQAAQNGTGFGFRKQPATATVS